MWMYIFEFLDFGDFYSLLCTNKAFNKFTNDHGKLWARECLKQYISFDLDIYRYHKLQFQTWF